jgi:transmembrane sensor
MESHRQVEDRAAAWLGKRECGDWTEQDQREFTQWMEESPAHRVAVLRLEAVWEDAGRLRALGAGLESGTVPPPGEWQRSPFFSQPNPREPSASEVVPQGNRTRPAWYATAAALLLAVALSGYLLFASRGDRYTTPIGGVASIPLRDGSKVTLNTASVVRVELSSKERRIELDRGEAFFEVAPDPTRPFIVQAGEKRVVAVGTQFSVRLEGEEIRVVVTDGKVRIDGAASTVPAIPAGNIANTGSSGIMLRKKSLAEVEDDLSWRQGYLTFRETSLADAVSEFNRYNVHKMRIADPALAATHISGTFRATNYEAFIRVLNEGFSIRAATTADITTLTQ